MIAFFAAFACHVPQYDNCDYNCCHPPHDASTSQVAYLRGSGGVEFDLHAIQEAPVLNFNAVFRKQYDTSTFSVYAGCGGCASARPSNWDTPLSLPLQLPAKYPQAKFEPFTSHAYYTLLPKGTARQVNTSTLVNCTSHHVSVRVVVHDNATEEIVWGAVVGCEGLECERFTALELLSFPIYVVRNHSGWNGAGWTLPLLALLVPLLMALIFWFWFEGWLVFYVPIGNDFPRMLAHEAPGTKWADLEPTICWVQSFRTLLYGLATWAITVDILETFAHFCIAAKESPAGDLSYVIFGYWFGLKWLLLLNTKASWEAAREVPEQLWRKYQWRYVCAWDDGFGPFSPFWAHGGWSIPEIGIGVVSLFVGAGFYVYPFAITLAGVLRLVHWVRKPGAPYDSNEKGHPNQCELRSRNAPSLFI